MKHFAHQYKSYLALTCFVNASIVGSVLFISTVIAGQANAQSSAVPGPPSAMHLPPITEIDNPLKGEIPLYPDKVVKGAAEQWETYLGGNIVRNVLNPTITPFLPPAGTGNGTAVIFVPGGGFKYEGMSNTEVDGFLTHGVTVFLLKYRPEATAPDPKQFEMDLYKWLFGWVAENKKSGVLDATPAPHSPAPALEDAMAATKLVRARAKEWGIDPQKIGMMGGSAGAMLSIDMAYTKDDFARPNFIVSEIGPKKVDPVPPTAPPLFVAASSDDPLFPGATENLVSAWSKAGIPVEAHFYERGGHGLDEKLTARKWMNGVYAWMVMHGWVAPGQ